MHKLIPILVLLFITSCSDKKDVTSQKYFNESEFTGLIKFEATSQGILLDYDLDRTDGKEIQFTSCSQVEHIKETEIVTHQFKLFRLLRINCKAAETYLKSHRFSYTKFPDSITKSLFSILPAQAVPDLGGEDLEMRKGQLMGKYEKNIQIREVKSNSFSVALTDGIEITYIILARIDYDNDGFEDWLIRLDWSIPESFGSGSDLMILSMSSTTDIVNIKWRY